jgi:hypothetical protein
MGVSRPLILTLLPGSVSDKACNSCSWVSYHLPLASFAVAEPDLVHVACVTMPLKSTAAWFLLQVERVDVRRQVPQDALRQEAIAAVDSSAHSSRGSTLTPGGTPYADTGAEGSQRWDLQ